MIKFIRRHWTIRLRLTVLYGGLFFVAGALLLSATYILVAQRLNGVPITLSTKQPPDKMVAKVNAPVGGDPMILNDPATKQQFVEKLTIAQEEFRAATMSSLLTQGGIALGGVGALAVGLGWLVAGRALRPLQQITETARRVADRSLHERIALDGPRDELRELADTFDGMLERLDRAFDGQRRFVGNASHELRTPLAINRTLLEVALGRPDASPDLRQLGHTLLEVNARNERLIEGLLTLAQSDNEMTDKRTVDLAEVAGHVIAQARNEAARSTVEIKTSLRAAPTSGDPVLLERLASNLVQNAVRYNAAGGWVSITTANGGDRVELTVTNTGPTVPGYEIPGLFEPFRRLADRVGSARGTGLGLSIVRSVARAHGGTVDAEPREGGGLVVRVALPATVT